MQIDVISDVVCPWCFIGKRRLARALAMRPTLVADVRWRAYRLDPTVPAGGLDRKAYLAAKFGAGPQVRQMGETIRTIGKDEGIAFAFDGIARTPNTLNAHRLIRWSASVDLQDEMVEALFRAYFEQGRDLGAVPTLVEIASSVGMDGELVSELLASEADVAAVEREDALAHQMGVSGVPTFIFAGRIAISGAEEPDSLLRAMDKAAELIVAGA